jgi:Fe-S cluster biogenesis protein NfuA
MSDAPTRRRIRAQASATDADVMGFVLDAPVQPGRAARFEGPGEAPLGRALFAIAGVARFEASGATVWVRKATDAEWATLKPAIAAAIRRVLDETEAPLGADEPGGDETGGDADAELLAAVEALLERQVNPAVAAHGGHIAAERVEGGTVHLRMSGGCQGCAASAATLRQGVERMLRAALPRIAEIVDVTDHAAGSNPFYARDDGASPVLSRPVPPGVLGWEDGQVTVDPDYLAQRLGLTPDALREGLRTGDVAGVTERGSGVDAGRTRIVLRSATRAWAAEILPDGSAREIPPPRATEAAADREQDLADRLRAYLAGLGSEDAPVSYGKLARSFGLWAPGSIRRITRALEITMREDAAANRPFIAARAVSRGTERLPGRGFFDLARDLDRGPRPGEDERDFHARETARLDHAFAQNEGRARHSS